MAAKYLYLRLVGSSVDGGIQKHTAPRCTDVATLPCPVESGDVVEQGMQLYDYFKRVCAQLGVNGRTVGISLAGPMAPMLQDTAIHMTQLAVDFNASSDRPLVREAAFAINEDMGFCELTELFYTMLSKSVDLDQDIVAIFFFCYDLTDRAINSQSDTLIRLTSQLRDVMCTTVWPMVQKCGGWDKLTKVTSDAFSGGVTSSHAASMRDACVTSAFSVLQSGLGFLSREGSTNQQGVMDTAVDGPATHLPDTCV